MNPERENAFKADLAALLNRYNVERVSGTPDYILAEYLYGQLAIHGRMMQERERWYGRGPTMVSLSLDNPLKF